MTACPTCAYAAEHGHWPTDGTHCGDTREGGKVLAGCHRSWRSTSQSHCVICHRHFGSDSAGDAHRVVIGKGSKAVLACRDPKGFDRWDTPDGPIFGGRDPEVGRRAAENARNARRPPRVKDESVGTLSIGGEG